MFMEIADVLTADEVARLHQIARSAVFIDGRSELYEATGVLRDYAQMIGAAPNAMKALDTYGIGSCLLEPKDPLAALLARQPEWQHAYEDDASVLYVKRAR